MKYDFSAQFLRVQPPQTCFGDAWEDLCFDLTSAHTEDTSLMKLNPPDCGIDFLSRTRKQAFQCKSDERGAFGSMSAGPSIDSLKSAVSANLTWDTYHLATNADYTGTALSAIEKAAEELGLNRDHLVFLGPAHWNNLCIKHPQIAEGRFDYRVSLTEAQVVEALRKARYFDKFVEEAKEAITKNPEEVTLTNNRTPLKLTIPFSPDLTIQQLLDVAKTTFGISLDWQNYSDTQTSCGPSLSITVNQRPQGFRKKLGELSPEEREELELWIQLVWRDETNSDGELTTDRMFLQYRWHTVERNALSYQQRRELTLSRTEELIQGRIWGSVQNLQHEATNEDANKRTECNG